jgi:hypothetical protein
MSPFELILVIGLGCGIVAFAGLMFFCFMYADYVK